ncbi:hypothetical protein AB0L47_29275 [Streptomyces bobili]|uniref:hypothetical protein n=1 Tax=Streptomyces bobili TaxID=67280 RepID=UPI003422E0F3
MEARVVGVDIGSVERGRFAWAAIDAPAPSLAGQGSDPETAVQTLAERLAAGGRAALVLEALMSVPMPVPVPAADRADGWAALGRARTSEGNRAWSAGPAPVRRPRESRRPDGSWPGRPGRFPVRGRPPGRTAGPHATVPGSSGRPPGRTAGPHATVPGARPSTRPDCWAARHGPRLQRPSTRQDRWAARHGPRLLLAEALVSGAGKPVPTAGGPHAADADADADAAARAPAGRLPGLPRIATDVECAPHGSLNLLAAAALWASMDLPADELRTDDLVLCARPASYAAAGERGRARGDGPERTYRSQLPLPIRSIVPDP